MLRGLLTGIMFGVVMVIFALQNSVKVPVKFLWMKFAEVPLALIVLIFLLTGVIITSLFAFIDKQRLIIRIKKLQARLKELTNPENEEESNQQQGDLNSEDGMTAEGEPIHKFFDY